MALYEVISEGSASATAGPSFSKVMRAVRSVVVRREELWMRSSRLAISITFCWVFLLSNTGYAQLQSGQASSASRTLEQLMDDAWKTSWSLFYHPRTRLFYDFVTSYEKGKSLDHLPRRDEVAREFPNSYGYDTGMEDCMISAGVMLTMVVDRYEVTGDRRLAAKAKSIFKGIQLTTTVHGSSGFVARGVAPDDGRSTYPSTSRDQVTHAVHGLWYYFNSALPDKATKAQIGQLLASIANRMRDNVTVENNYDFLRSDGKCEPIGLQRMWTGGGHEVARLPMIFAAAWNATGVSEYRDLYEKYAAEAIEQSRISLAGVSTWALLQMQASFELIDAIEGDAARKAIIADIKRDVAQECRRRAARAWEDGKTLDLTTLAADWRLPDGGIKSKGPYRKVWYCVRQSGESALAQVMAGADEFPPDQVAMLEGAIRRINYNRVSTNGIYYLQAAYWKARRLKIFET